MKSLKRMGIGLLAGLISMISVSQTAFAAGSDNYVTGDNNHRQPIPTSYCCKDFEQYRGI